MSSTRSTSRSSSPISDSSHSTDSISLQSISTSTPADRGSIDEISFKSTAPSSISSEVEVEKDDATPRYRLPSPFLPPTQSNDIASEWTADTLPSEYPSLPLSIKPTQTDAKDIGTPDEWILRDPSLVRLTGRWPFNCEPPLPALWNAVSRSVYMTRPLPPLTRSRSAHLLSVIQKKTDFRD